MPPHIQLEMESLTIEQLYGVINRCKAENSGPALLIAHWAQQVIDRKFGN